MTSPVKQTERRVGIVVSDMGGGGAPSQAIALIASLHKKGVPCSLIVFWDYGPRRKLIPPDVDIVELGPSWCKTILRDRRGSLLSPLARALASVIITARLVRLLRGERFDVLIATQQTVNTCVLVADLFAQRDIAIVVRQDVHPSIAESERLLSLRFAYGVLPYLYRRASAVVGVSQAITDALGKRLPSETNLRTIYNPAPTKLPHPSRVAPHPWLRADEPVVLSVGRLTREKNHALFIHVLAELRKRRPVRGIILGDGRERHRLLMLRDRLGLAEVLDLPGFVEEPLPWMSDSSLLLHTAKSEGFGNVLVEALHVGTPVVALDCPGGPREILDGGRFGALVASHSAVDLADAVERVLDAPPDAAALMARAGEFTVERTVTGYSDLIEDLRR